VRIGFRTSPQKTDWASLEAAWAEAGQHEIFDSGWLNDHLTDPGLERGGPSFETMTTLAALARHVPGKTVGPTVLSATFRHPSVLANEALTLDHITGGRFILGLGAGWHVGEHEAFGIDLPPLRERFDRFESTVRILKALFTDEARQPPGVSVDAPPWRLDRATMEPGFVRPGGPPLWLGGQGPRGLRIAARHADGWNYASNLDETLEGFRRRLETLRGECEAIGRDPAALTISTQIVIPADPAGRRTATERAIAFGRAGSDEILLTTPARDGADGIRRLASEVAAPIREAFG
jgi:alkanesulfonate monooxygenase SsuD/methylene tetrahydromethanopterin reductase-like flavin-dependent oxidoreductase (luciferase family)